MVGEKCFRFLCGPWRYLKHEARIRAKSFCSGRSRRLSCFVTSRAGDDGRKTRPCHWHVVSSTRSPSSAVLKHTIGGCRALVVSLAGACDRPGQRRRRGAPRPAPLKSGCCSDEVSQLHGCGGGVGSDGWIGGCWLLAAVLVAERSMCSDECLSDVAGGRVPGRYPLEPVRLMSWCMLRCRQTW